MDLAGGGSGRGRVALMALAAAAGASAGAAPLAAAEVRFTFEGRGFGHGVGLSQYGARGAALQGWEAPRILGWYYRGATVTTVGARSVRILLANGHSGLTVGVTGAPGRVTAAGSGASGRLVPGVRYTIAPGARGPVLRAPGGAPVAQGARLRVTPAGGGLVSLGGGRYRGSLDVTPDGGGLDAVNTVSLEDYLRGVVPREMPASWPDEALRAQAIAARSYAAAGLRPDAPYDLFADVRSQVYGGAGAEHPRTDRAVASTARQVLTSGNEIIRAYFSSTSGGYTESVENAFGGSPAPYLVGVPDPFDGGSPLHRWSSPPSYTASQLGARLRVGGPVADVEVLRRGVSPRVMTARVTTAGGRSVELSGNIIKARLGLPDTWFWIRRSDRPAPAEPVPTGGAAAPAAPAGRGTPAVAPARSRGYLVVASRQGRLRDARVVARRLLAARPRTVLVARTVRGARVYLVVTLRNAARRPALRERARLRTLGYASVITPARARERVVRVVPARGPATRPATPARPARPARPATPARPGTPAAPSAPAASGFTVIAASLEQRGQAQEVVTRLRATGRAPSVVARWTAASGTRYLVVTLRGATAAAAGTERDALRRLGYGARVERAAG